MPKLTGTRCGLEATGSSDVVIISCSPAVQLPISYWLLLKMSSNSSQIGLAKIIFTTPSSGLATTGTKLNPSSSSLSSIECIQILCLSSSGKFILAFIKHCSLGLISQVSIEYIFKFLNGLFTLFSMHI
uniref:Uncharacterized protein n=1 Tax=Meloidogyne enterolobii TaxID=390850 RepID=A0A6V7WVC4_MELEN|nr:unnamed protein product [Meloidogyne enterolobii]